MRIESRRLGQARLRSARPREQQQQRKYVRRINAKRRRLGTRVLIPIMPRLHEPSSVSTLGEQQIDQRRRRGFGVAVKGGGGGGGRGGEERVFLTGGRANESPRLLA